MSISKNDMPILSIKELLSKDNYIIPLYQRNYAWGREEITQLLEDIWDKSKDTESKYYIGTLVIDERKNNDLEIIDGQQRHTTLTLINAVIASQYSDKTVITKSNLRYEARTEIENFVDRLYGNWHSAIETETDNKGLLNILFAVKEIRTWLFSKKRHARFEIFLKYFFENVLIIRVQVPEDTDINHYFEIMNNRGEQLEKHEILKARFLHSLKDDKVCYDGFAEIWGACSQMDKHIQTCFAKEKRRDIFGENYTGIPENYLRNIRQLSIAPGKAEDIAEVNIEEILSSITSGSETVRVESISLGEAKFKSIIDFPNFLLQILKLKEETTSLDDKSLLSEFGGADKSKKILPDAVDFADSLLKYRTLFDKYIIKREVTNDDNWQWKILMQNSSDETGYKNTFGANNEQIILCQSMLHVSFPSNSYKNWLFNILKELEGDLIETKFIEKLETISHELLPENLSEVCNNGTYTPNYLFNYLDYVLWKQYKNPANSGNDLIERIEKNKERFNRFRFTQRSSVEHLLPQSKKVELDDDTSGDYADKDKILNHFGNLCLISSSNNSKYNDFNFPAKKEYYDKSKAIESLKQVIMFSYDDWNTKQIKDHGEEMIKLITGNSKPSNV